MNFCFRCVSDVFPVCFKFVFRFLSGLFSVSFKFVSRFVSILFPVSVFVSRFLLDLFSIRFDIGIECVCMCAWGVSEMSGGCKCIRSEGGGCISCGVHF